MELGLLFGKGFYFYRRDFNIISCNLDHSVLRWFSLEILVFLSNAHISPNFFLVKNVSMSL